MEEHIEEYLRKETDELRDNANTSYSFSGLMSSISEKAIKKYMLNNFYPKDISDAHKNGFYYIHDLGFGIIGYCAGWSLRELLENGFNGVLSKVQSAPPKHLRTALGQMVNFLGTIQLEFAGAQAFSSFDTYLAPYVRKDNLSYSEVKQSIQEFIFGLNIPSRFALQTPFTNITLDWTVPNDLKNKHPKIGGKVLKETYGDYQKEMDIINKALLEVMGEGDKDGRPFTFPIPTYNLTKDFIWDNDNAKLLFELTAKYGLPYFQNFINSDLDPNSVRSMCPMTGDTKVVVRSKQNGVTIKNICDVYSGIKYKKTIYDVWTPSGWAKGLPTKQIKQDIYEVTLSNGYKVKLGEYHEQPIKGNKTVLVKDLLDYKEKKYWIPFSKKGYDGEYGSYDTGVVIGAFIGDGSYDNKSIIYSLDIAKKDDETEGYIRHFFNNLGYNVKTTISDKNVRFVRVNGNVRPIIERYVSGDNALTKKVTRYTMNASKEFRKGLLYGLRLTDGARDCNRLYTSSPQLKEDITVILASIGKKWMANYEDNRDGRYGTNTNYRIDYPNRERYGNLYDEDDDYHYFKIINIEKIDKDLELYCFEIDNDDHLFTLASGMVTHNCRLRLDIKELLKRGNGLFGSGELTGSIGVVTLNLPRLAWEAKKKVSGMKRIDGSEEEAIEIEYFKLIKKYATLAKESLEMKRKKIQENYDKGLMPYTKVYLKTWNNHFNTIGVIGGNEASLNLIGKDITTIEGQSITEKTLKYILDILKEFQEETGNLYNLEATPAEGSSYRLAVNDKKKCDGIITAGTDENPYYTNSTHLPVDYTRSLFKAIKLQNNLQKIYTSGTVLHTYVGERITDWINCMMLVKKIAYNSELPFFSITPSFSICPVHGYISGEHSMCPLDHSEEDLKKYGILMEE